MPIIKWEPFGDIERFFDDRPLGSLFPKLGWDLAVDVFEEEGAVVAKMSLPGINPDDLDITIEDDMLTISGSREEEKETDKKNYYSKEIRRGSFSRSVSLPKEVYAGKTEATYADGVLKVSMPVKADSEKKAVQVKVTK